MKTQIIAAFCGTGKTHFCNQPDLKAVEVQYHLYQDKAQYLQDINKQLGQVEYILLASDTQGLRLLNHIDLLVYPENQLRNEYLDRYLQRDSPYEFIGAFMKYWDKWLNELKEVPCNNHCVLKTGQFLSDVISNSLW